MTIDDFNVRNPLFVLDQDESSNLDENGETSNDTDLSGQLVWDEIPLNIWSAILKTRADCGKDTNEFNFYAGPGTVDGGLSDTFSVDKALEKAFKTQLPNIDVSIGTAENFHTIRSGGLKYDEIMKIVKQFMINNGFERMRMAFDEIEDC